MRHEYLFIVPHMHVQVFLCTSPHLILPRYLEFAVWETKDIAHFSSILKQKAEMIFGLVSIFIILGRIYCNAKI